MAARPSPEGHRKYKPLRVLGRGASGQAVLVRAMPDDRLKVAKLIPLAGLSTEKKECALNEVKLLKRVSSHKHIVHLEESFFKDNNLYIITEYCEGGDLSKRITHTLLEQKRRFSEIQILEWLTQIAEALEFVHSKQIVHRDLKPTNIFLTANGEARIGDFGIATTLAKDSFAETQVGTPLYLSPELCDSQPYDFKTDVWSLGCIIYECCTGRPPFPANSLTELMKKILNHDPSPITSKHYSKMLTALIWRMLRKNPEDRPTASDILLATRSILQLGQANKVPGRIRSDPCRRLSTVSNSTRGTGKTSPSMASRKLNRRVQVQSSQGKGSERREDSCKDWYEQRLSRLAKLRNPTPTPLP